VYKRVGRSELQPADSIELVVASVVRWTRMPRPGCRVKRQGDVEPRISRVSRMTEERSGVIIQIEAARAPAGRCAGQVIGTGVVVSAGIDPTGGGMVAFP
jgi:hypothetical protein